MPRFLPPRRTGAHRIAAIALYRALLTQCKALPLPAQPRDELQNIVRNRFKQARGAQGVASLRISFEAGYEAITHLDASVHGDLKSTEYISSLLERAPERLKVPPAVKQQLSKEKDKSISTEDTTGPYPSILDRPVPLAQLSGKRHVPVLYNANGIPILRTKKPQPEILSRLIRQRIQQRQRRLDSRMQLLDDKSLAAREDEWDTVLSQTSSRSVSLAQAMGGGVRAEPRWTDAVGDAIRVVEERLEGEKVKNRAMAERMQDVVDRERAMLEDEKKMLKKGRKGVRRKDH